jgi:hypothetical protein
MITSLYGCDTVRTVIALLAQIASPTKPPPPPCTEASRSRDPDASKVALASMARSGDLPAPRRLIAANAPSLTFSETFLFNADYRFQLRSIAAPQSWE